MRVSVFGLGYVGSVTAACLAAEGHQVIGVDPNETKIELIRGGGSPVIEERLPELLAEATRSGRLTVTSDHREGVEGSDLALICVGTPSRPDGSVDLSWLRQVLEQIGGVLAEGARPFTVAVRSTIPPGTSRGMVIATLEASSDRKVGESFEVCFVPEFLREGSSVRDYYDPPKLVVAGTSSAAIGRIVDLMPATAAPFVELDFEAAEMVKYVDNAWHGLKVGFANEIGRFAKTFGVDSRAVMDAFKLDTKLNISGSYLSPGFAFGGSCLPKDLRALEHAARMNNVDVPILNSVLDSNQRHILAALELLATKPGHRVGVLGLSFKAGTDDLRESPMVELAERLIGKGYDLRIFDPTVRLSSLMGANRAYVMAQIPHLAKLMVETLEEAVEHAEIVVVGTGVPEFTRLADMEMSGRHVIDLAGVLSSGTEGVDGICW